MRYPENIIFRIGMLGSCFGMGLEFLFIYWWLKAVNKANLSVTNVSKAIMYVGWAGVFFFSLTVATIDSGKMNTKLHGVVSVIFFVLYSVVTVIITITISNVRKVNPNIISKFSWGVKKNITYFMIVPWILVIVREAARLDKMYECIGEWVGVFMFIFYLGSFKYDF